MTPGSEAIRGEYLCSESEIYLNTAAFGKVSTRVANAGTRWLQNYREDSNFILDWIENNYNAIRQKTADFIWTSSANISFQPNFSIGLNLLLESLNPKSALLYKDDYPSLRLPFELKGIELTYVDGAEGKLDEEKFKDEIKRLRPTIVAVSHVQFLTGQKVNLTKLSSVCKQVGSVLLVDTTQSLGIIDTKELASVDIHIGSAYKWLGAGYGNAVMYLSDSILNALTPKVAGFGSMTFIDGKPVYEPSIRSFEPGHHNWMTLEMLSASLDFHNAIGTTAIQNHGQTLANKFCELLKNAGIIPVVKREKDGSPIVSYALEDSIKNRLTSENVIFAERGGACRFSFHCFNTEEEVQKLAEIITQ